MMSTRDTFVEEDGFGFLSSLDPKNNIREIVRRYTLTNKHKASVQLISWGAAIQSIKIPNKSGILGDVVLGFDNIDGYLKNRYTGSIISRVVNRIPISKMRVTNNNPDLTINDKDRCNCYNGGFIGFENVNWHSYILNKEVVMSHLTRRNVEGYPSNMLTQIKYSWTDDNQLHVNIRATATKPTPANITNYCLFNLAGHGTGPEELKKHVVSINSGSWTVVDIKENLPTGAIYPVDRTIYDLRLPTQLTRGKLYNVPGGGYNHNLCITSPSSWCYRFHARILHPGSGRTLELYSNQPGLQFYTGNDLPDPDRICPPDFEDYSSSNESVSSGSSMMVQMETLNEKDLEIWGKDGVRYRRHGGFVLMPQNYPDSININSFPSYILYPGAIYVHDMSYKFGVLS